MQAVVAGNLLPITALWLRHAGAAAVHDSGAALTAASQLTGLCGTFASLVAIVLMARMPSVEQLVGRPT